MKYTIKLLVVAVFTAFLTSCGYLAQKADPKGYSQAVTNTGVKPLHIGSPASRRDGVYHVQIYQRSVVFMATTGLIRPSQVEVFDLDHNGTFDVVYLKQNNIWSIGFNPNFRSKYKTLDSSLSQKTTHEWISKAVNIKRSTYPNRTRNSSPQPKPVTEISTMTTQPNEQSQNGWVEIAPNTFGWR